MAQKKNRPRRPADDGQPVLQLNSHQLTYAVVGLIASFGILFTLGILTGRMSDQTGPGRSVALGRGADARGEGHQSAPRRDMLESGRPEDAPIKEFAAPSGAVDERHSIIGRNDDETPEPAQPVKPVISEPTPPWESQAPESPEPAEDGEAAKRKEEPPAPREADPGNEGPTLAASEGSDAEGAPATEESGIEAPSPALVDGVGSDPEEVVADSVPPPPPIRKRGKYTVQVASFTARNRKRAEAFVKELAKTEKVEASIVQSEDGKWCRVVVGQYADRASATKAWNDLKKRPRFKECFIKGLD